ncbi:hypothetical protein PMAYCL1PPCAC_05772, partial [Pristionchus mayeri]
QLSTIMSILEPTEEQKNAYLARVPKAEIFGDEILAGLIASSQKVLSLKDFPLDENDIIIASYPKSGSYRISDLVSAIAHEGNIESFNELAHEQRIPWLELDDKYLPETMPLHSSRRGNLPGSQPQGHCCRQFQLPQSIQDSRIADRHVLERVPASLLLWFHRLWQLVQARNYLLESF